MKCGQTFINPPPALRGKRRIFNKEIDFSVSKASASHKAKKKKEFIGGKFCPSRFHSTNPMRSQTKQPNTEKRSLSNLFTLHSSLDCHLVGKFSYLNCSQKGTHSSSAFKTSGVQPGVNRPWYWYHRTTSLHSIFHVHSLQTLGDLSIDRDV